MDSGADKRLQAVSERFEAIGGRFLSPIDDVARRVAACRGIVFDWDGVFNSGAKSPGVASGFTEPDSMGTNMLRYGLWRQTGDLPYTAIISGEENPAAMAFARREHFTEVHVGVSDKQTAIDALCARQDMPAGQLACVFDDINDLSMAGMCGLRCMVQRDANPMLAEHVEKRGLCDYMTGPNGYPVREVCELLLGILGIYDDVVDSRVAYDEEYRAFWRSRQAVVTGGGYDRDVEAPDSAQQSPGGRLARGRP